MKKEPVDLKAFAQYIQDKSIPQLLHRARKESLKRILAHEDIAYDDHFRAISHILTYKTPEDFQ
jgi:hypothetical protein